MAGVYHVTARGIAQTVIFECDSDKERFLETLDELSQETGVSIYAYCLMDNHVHLLLKADLKIVSRFLQRLLGSYVKYFNLKYERTGSLFEGRFDSEPIQSDEYLFAVLRYIHRNPIEAGITRTYSYEWSSYKEFAAGRGICKTNEVIELLGGLERFERLHQLEQDQGFLADIIFGRTPRPNDGQALLLAQRVLQTQNISYVGSLPKEERNQKMQLLRDAGLSIRQISRITGVGRNIVERSVRRI